MPTPNKSQALAAAADPTMPAKIEPTTNLPPPPTKEDGEFEVVCDGDVCRREPKATKGPSAATKPIATGKDEKEMKNVLDEEEVLKEGENRFVLIPIRYDPLYRLYKKGLSAFWIVEEVDLSQDMKDWDSMTDGERYFIKNVLAFFAAADGMVIENLAERFMNDVKLFEAKLFYAVQIQQEAVHSEMYSILLDTFVRDQAEKAKLFAAMKTMPAVKAKADWALKWMASDRPFAERLVAFAAVEMIMFSGSFCALYWLKKRGKMPGLTFSNEKIAADEQLHCTFAITLFSLLKKKPAQSVVYDIVKSALEAEREFICESLPAALIGINSDLMTQYIEFVADYLLDALGCDKLYKVQNPFDWMVLINLQGKSNFFERRVGEYQKPKANVIQSSEHQKGQFVPQIDF